MLNFMTLGHLATVFGESFWICPFFQWVLLFSVLDLDEL